jgi:fructosamine-3-kinase
MSDLGANLWPRIAAQIRQFTNISLTDGTCRSIGGGCINQTYQFEDSSHRFFVKLNQAAQIGMFAAEASGLRQIWESQTIRVPKPICWGIVDQFSYLVLEWLDLGGSIRSSWETMGQQLAALHHVTSSQEFGWDMNNTIGSTPQLNPWTASWISFFAQHRLGYQFRLASRRGGEFPQQQVLLDALPDILSHDPSPALVHGDLWSGNAAMTQAGEPVIFDPAPYFGDREVDIAMTELFGGFPTEFYQGYNAAYPLKAGYQHRKTLYNLYHILNHFNLFGGGYAAQANRMIAQILAEC